MQIYLVPHVGILAFTGRGKKAPGELLYEQVPQGATAHPVRTTLDDVALGAGLMANPTAYHA